MQADVEIQTLVIPNSFFLGRKELDWLNLLVFSSLQIILVSEFYQGDQHESFGVCCEQQFSIHQ